MRTRNMILSGVFALMLVMLVTQVRAFTVDTGSDYDNKLPKVYKIKTAYQFCQDDWLTDSGSTPDSHDLSGVEDLETMGCIEWKYGERTQNYAFTGEVIAELVVARDPNGAQTLRDAFMAVGGVEYVLCSPLSQDDLAQCTGRPKDCDYFHDSTSCGNQDGCHWDSTHKDCDGRATDCEKILDSNCLNQVGCSLSEVWNGHDVSAELDSLPETYTMPDGGVGAIPAGFDDTYDQLYECYMVVIDEMYGDITVNVYDSKGGMGTTEGKYVQTMEFNPAVTLSIDGDVSFPQTFCQDGVFVPADGTLTIANDAGIVQIAVWLGGTDLRSPDAWARCPDTNVLDVDKYMEFRCCLNGRVGMCQQEWQQVNNKDVTDPWGCWIPVGGLHFPWGPDTWTCFGLNPIFTETPEGFHTYNILLPGDTAECEFRLEYPCPCDGEFTDGAFVILIRAI